MIKKNINSLLIISLILFFASIVYFGFKSSKSFYPDQQIQSVSRSYLAYFERNAFEIENSLIDIKNSFDSINLSVITQNEFISLLIEKLNNRKQLSSILLLEHGSKMTILEKDQGTFLYAVDSSEITDVVAWQRLDKDLKIKNSWNRALGVELNVLEWGSDVFNDSYKYQVPIWTSVERLIENARRSTAVHITWRSKLNDRILTCIVILNDLNEFELIPSHDNLKIQKFIRNINDQIIPVFGNHSIDSLSENLRKTAIRSWEITGASLQSTFNFSNNNLNYWGQSLGTDLQGISLLILVVEENTLRLSIFLNNLFLTVSIAFLLIIIIVLFFVKLYKHSKTRAIDKFIISQISDQQTSDLIKLGENNQLEFKSSFRYDYKLENVNKDLEYVIAKSIAAFSNGKGGTLLIGIDDHGNILGLENDIYTLKRKDIDFFENFLRAFLNKMFSVSFVTNNLRIKFPVIEKKIICRVDVEPGTQPVFIEVIKNNTKSEKFYVRSGNTSMEMIALSEINGYIQERF